MYHQLNGKPESAIQAADVATRRGDHTLTVGLNGVCHLDAPVISSLVTALRRMRDARGTVRLHVTRPDLLAALHQVGLDRVFTITSTEDEPRTKGGPPKRRRKRSGWARKLAGGFAGIFGALLVLDSFAKAAIGMSLH